MHFFKMAVMGLCVLATCTRIKAQQNQLPADSLPLRMDSAENRFLTQNLLLLAQQYNIDAQKALVIQARLFPNPNLEVGQLVYNKDSKSVFPIGKNGENTIVLSQLIQLAGKRNKSIQLAQANARLSELAFADLLRTLKYTLHVDYFRLYYLQQSAKSYKDEINALQVLVNAFKEQEGKGYIAEKEVVRVKAQLLSLQGELNDLNNDMNDVQSELRVLLHQPNSAIVPQIDKQHLENLNPQQYGLNTLLDSAYANRTDLNLAKANTQVSQLNLSYQKALAVPDLTASLNYDQQGGFVGHEVQLGVAIDLPFFNRNQGNIKSAGYAIKAAQAAEVNTQAGVQESVYRALQKAYDMEKMYKNLDPQFESDFQRLQQEVLLNYQKRNISLLDFLDFYDSYKQNILQANQLRFNRINAFEDINYFTATDFFKY